MILNLLSLIWRIIKKMATKNYEDFLFDTLRDPEIAAQYLSSAIADGSIDEFLLALKSVADSHGGISNIAEISDLNRQNLYKILSEDGNPTIKSLVAILKAIGIKINFEADDEAA